MKINNMLKTKKGIILLGAILLVVLIIIFSIIKVNNTATFADYIIDLSTSDKENLVKDDYGNIRYVGANPNNYVLFNDELWRIIGVFDGKLKIIRNESIGEFSWDISDEQINEGHGIGEWSQADLMNELNTDYLDTSLSGKKQWNCGEFECSFDSKLVLSKEYQQLISKNTWNTGAIYWKYNSDSDYSSLYSSLYLNLSAKDIYEYEINDVDHKLAFKNDSSYNDNVVRKAKWNGIVGLPSLSDILYSSTEDCSLNKIAEKYNIPSTSSYCFNDNWMINGVEETDLYWTLNTLEFIFYDDMENSSEGILPYLNWFAPNTVSFPSYAYNVKPTVFLKKSVKLYGGDGSADNPFVVRNNKSDFSKDISSNSHKDNNRSNTTNIKETTDTNTPKTNSEYDVSMFEELNTTEAITKIKNGNKVVLYIGRSTDEYCIKFLPNLQKAQEEFGYKTIYVDLDKIIASGDQDKWANEFQGVLGEYDEACDTRIRYYHVKIEKPSDECGEFGATPMIVIFENGEIKDSFIGYEEYDKFASFLENNGFKK